MGTVARRGSGEEARNPVHADVYTCTWRPGARLRPGTQTNTNRRATARLLHLLIVAPRLGREEQVEGGRLRESVVPQPHAPGAGREHDVSFARVPSLERSGVVA